MNADEDDNNIISMFTTEHALNNLKEHIYTHNIDIVVVVSCSIGYYYYEVDTPNTPPNIHQYRSK